MANIKTKGCSLNFDALIFSSLPKNSGCFLRASYLSSALKNNKMNVKLVIPPKNLPIIFHFIVSFILNFIQVFFYKFKIGIAIKPYPNTLIPLIVKKFFSNIIISVDIDDIDFGYRKGILNKISRIIQKPLPKFFDIVTYHNRNLKEFILKEYKVSEEKLYLLKQGVDFEIYKPMKDCKKFKKIFCKKYRIPFNSKLIVYTAHLNIAADLDIILENIGSILRDNFYLIIAGGGPMYSFYKSYAEKLKLKNIIFTAYLPPVEISKIVNIADLAIVYYKDKPVNYYRASMKVREYLALKKRVVCNDVGELKEFKNYVYQSKTDINSFIKKIDYIIRNNITDGREKIGYEFVNKEYDWNKIGFDFKRFIDREFGLNYIRV